MKRELKRRSKEWEQVGMTVAVPGAGEVTATGTSPLTAPTTNESTKESKVTTSSTSRRRKSRKSPRQACDASRLDAKIERNDLALRYKTAFKQAMALMANPLHDGQLIQFEAQFDWDKNNSD